MLLSLPELAALEHLPADDVKVSGLERGGQNEKAPLQEALSGGIFLGYNEVHGTKREVRLPVETRMRHVHVVGASGTGKSTLLVSMILQDIAAGHGVGVIDPHGDLIDHVLGGMPENRAADASVPEVERAVLGNAYTRICFRLGDEDARTLSQGFSFFTADDLGNLDTGRAICRVGRKEHDFNLSVVPVGHGDPEAYEAKRREIRVQSLARWGSPRTEEPPPDPVPPEVPRRDAPLSVEVQPEPVAPQRETAPPPPAPSPAPAQVHAPEPPVEPHRPGKGGPEHTYLQELIKRWGEEKGFRAVVEEQIAGGRESIDVALYRGEMRIACEVSVTTPLEYEVGNVEKCLAAGFGQVAVVSLKKARLAKLGKLLDEAIPPAERQRVLLFTTEELLAWLEGQPVWEEVKTVRGWKVKVKYRDPGDDRLKRVAEILARSTSGLQKDEK